MCSLIAFLLLAPLAAAQTAITINSAAPAHPLPHFWEHMFGSGRANLSLRDSYRRDLRDVKQATDVKYIRFHAIFLDDIGVYDEDAQGNAVYNFSYVDQIYDGLLDSGVRPFVELSFMPKKLASDPQALHPFWYKQNVSPPKDFAKWDDLVYQFTKHLVDRYGIDEVSQWYFEVWNEPNIDFWAGKPQQPTYFELYDHSAKSVKKVSEKLRVGGPATAQAAWVDDLIKHCADNHIPLNFVSSHVYGNDSAKDVFGTDEKIPRENMVCRSVEKVHKQIKASAMPELPLFWSEYNASYMNEPAITDSTYMGPWMADTIRQCDGLVTEMSYWSFSDVFEEQGVVKQPFYGGYGLIAADNIHKPAFNVFKILHLLGNERLDVNSDSALVTRRPDGRLVVALWSYASPKTIQLKFEDNKARRATIHRVDRDHGDPHPAYEKQGSPRYPTQSQLKEIRQSTELPAPEIRRIEHGELTVEIPANGLAVIEIK
ncbi:MAG TPA: glycosyl hydrolase family 39 [Terriglobales bacterium]|nr:glycosyl hydrolase family 39 [Terriglobales bacterium]